MTSQIETLKLFSARCIACSSKYLQHVNVAHIPNELKSAVLGNSIKPKACFSNSLFAGMACDANAVNIGAVFMPDFDIAIEHAWIEKDNQMYDPTFEKYLKNTDVEKLVYFSLYRIPLASYLTHAKELGKPNYAIDPYVLRHSPLTKHLFAH